MIITDTLSVMELEVDEWRVVVCSDANQAEMKQVLNGVLQNELKKNISMRIITNNFKSTQPKHICNRTL